MSAVLSKTGTARPCPYGTPKLSREGEALSLGDEEPHGAGQAWPATSDSS